MPALRNVLSMDEACVGLTQSWNGSGYLLPHCRLPTTMAGTEADSLQHAALCRRADYSVMASHKGTCVCRKKLAALKQIGDPMSFRAAESAARPKAVEGARQLLELIGKSSNAWPTIKPWLNETDIKGLTVQVSQPFCTQHCSQSLGWRFHFIQAYYVGKPSCRFHSSCTLLLRDPNLHYSQRRTFLDILQRMDSRWTFGLRMV